jgi:hypothetical protein
LRIPRRKTSNLETWDDDPDTIRKIHRSTDDVSNKIADDAHRMRRAARKTTIGAGQRSVGANRIR